MWFQSDIICYYHSENYLSAMLHCMHCMSLGQFLGAVTPSTPPPPPPLPGPPLTPRWLHLVLIGTVTVLFSFAVGQRRHHTNHPGLALNTLQAATGITSSSIKCCRPRTVYISQPKMHSLATMSMGEITRHTRHRGLLGNHNVRFKKKSWLS